MLECDPPRRLVYTFRVEFDPEARKLGHSRVAFTLEPQPEGMVKLTLVHDELPSEEVARGYLQGWAPILSSLRRFSKRGDRCWSSLASWSGDGRKGAGGD